MANEESASTAEEALANSTGAKPETKVDKKETEVGTTENKKSDSPGESEGNPVATKNEAKTKQEGEAVRQQEEEVTAADPALVQWIKDNTNIKSEWQDENVEVVEKFLVKPECRKLVAFMNEDGKLEVQLDTFPSLGETKKIQFFLKAFPEMELNVDSIGDCIFHGILSGDETMDSLVRIMQSLYIPTFLGNKTWPESVRKEFSGQLHRFMATLVDATNQKKGKTILYLPEEDLSDATIASKNKDLVQRLESTLLHWTKQIKEVVSGSENTQQLEASGPIEEIELWGRRDKDLSGIKRQLEQPRLKEIINVLQLAKSSYVTNFQSLASMIHEGSSEAISNLKFLSPLKAPCEKMAKSTPDNIPDILPKILNIIRMITTLSPHYSSQEKITNLLLRVSHQIIVQCKANINLEDLFGKDVTGCIAALSLNIHCCGEWRKIYDETVELISRSNDTRKWDSFDHGTIFAQIEAFKKRCFDLTEVCEGQLQFSRKYIKVKPGERAPIPVFGGSSGRAIGKSLFEIEDAFEKQLNKMRNLDYDILNVKSTDWHDDFNAFKDGMSDLEVMLTNVISSAWEGISTVKSGVELLDAFFQIARRNTMKPRLAARVSAVYTMFAAEVKRVKNCFESDKRPDAMHSSSCAPIRRNSRMCGSAMWARGLLERVREDMEILQEATWLPHVVEASEAVKKFKSLESLLVTYVSSGCFDKWEQQIRDEEKAMPSKERLKQYLLSRSSSLSTESVLGESHLLVRNPEGRLECQFDKRIIEVHNDVYYWNIFNEVFTQDAVSIPHQARQIQILQERLRVIRDQVMQVVREYNKTKEYLTDDEERLFEYHLGKLDRYVSIGINRLTWAKKDYIKKFVGDSTDMCQNLFDTVSIFKENNESIDRICAQISKSELIKLIPNKVYFDEEFNQIQRHHHVVLQNRFHKWHAKIKETLEGSYKFFENVPLPSVKKEWAKYIRKIDKKLLGSFKKAVRNSLTRLSHLVKVKEKAASDREIQPLFKISVRLDRKDIAFEPSMNSLKKTVRRVQKEAIKCLEVFPKMMESLDSTKAVRLAGVQWGDVESKEGGEEGSAEGGEEKKEEADEKSDKKPTTFHQEIVSHPSTKEMLKRTDLGMLETHEKMDAHVQKEYKPHSKIWNTDKKKYVRSWGSTRPGLKDFVQNIKIYENKSSQFQHWDNIIHVGFVRLDINAVKASLIQQCGNWKKEFITLLHNVASTELMNLQDYFQHNSRVLREHPENLVELKDMNDLLAKVNSNKEATHQRFEPLESQYRAMEKFGKHVSDDEKEMLESLRSNWTVFTEMLAATEERMKRVKQNFKKQLEESQQNYSRDIAQMRKNFVQFAPYKSDVEAGQKPDVAKAMQFLEREKKVLTDMAAREKSMQAGMQLFKLDRIDYPEIKNNEKEIRLLEKLWSLYENWFRHYDSWKGLEFTQLDPEQLDQFSRLNLNKLKKLFQQNKRVQGWQAWFTLDETIKQFKKTMGPINNLRNPAIRQRHWDTLKKEIGKSDFDPYSKEFTLGTVITLGLHKIEAEVANLALIAMKELAMEGALGDIEGAWGETELEIIVYKADYFKIIGVENLNETLENHQLQLSTMKNSPYYATFATSINFWMKTLNDIVECMDAALLVQQQWMYLESIFKGSDHIRKQLPEETKLFEGVHRGWLDVMGTANQIKNVQKVFTQPGLVKRLAAFNADLEKIQKNLAQFLAGKRKAFPRFYFLSDQDLLEILANAKDPLAVQPHINKLFVGIQKMVLKENKFNAKKWDAVGMTSKDKEEVAFNSPYLIDGEVENWLKGIEACQCDTLRRQTKLAMHKLHKNKKNAHNPSVLNSWIDGFPGQMLITTGQIHWSIRCEESLGAVKVRKEMRNLKKDWQEYMFFLAKQMTGKMSKTKRKKMSALITIEVHAREVISKLKQLAKQGADANSFDWKKQLRFYFDSSNKEHEDGQVTIQQTNTRFNYSYEYQGNPFRLVITPLTDRCYMTLTTALSLARGGSPMGPAGTGKTETVKDLAKNMAINIYVFNCSDEMSVDGLARIYKGLAQSGSWGCFDEFNRILIEVLSVIAMQIQAILNAIRDESETFMLHGEIIPLVPTVGIFITMNPGYAGRTELPENLKALFRPVAMMVPDTRLIAEVMMLSQGFKDAHDLSVKMDTIYELMKMQLSKQSHYDYGLRAINAVIKCALMIRARDPTMTERLIAYTAIRNMNLSKMVSQDKTLFENLLNDAFPGTEPPKEDLGALTKEIRNQLKIANLDPSPVLIQKVIETYMAFNTRHGNMLVGNTMGAKTTAWKILKAAQDALWEKKIETDKYQAVDVYLLNPKSITNPEMYGNYDLQTREWTDGILSVNMREACTSTTPNQKWMLMDGPVDTLWIESMNTVLDDNKVLTLVNGDRIALPLQVRMVFEVENLDVASPATVSRAGMVYLPDKDLGWMPYVRSWIKFGCKPIGIFKADEKLRVQEGIEIKVVERPAAEQELLQGLVEKYMDECLEYKRLNCKEEVTVGAFPAVKSFCKLFDSLATKENGCDIEQKTGPKMFQMWFMYCICWSIGGALSEAGRETFDKFFREIAEPSYPSMAGSTVFEYFVDVKKQDWSLWRTQVDKTWKPKPGTSFFNIYVPTLDTVRYKFLVNTMLKDRHYPLLVGNTGTGKTCCAVNCLGEGSILPEEKVVTLTLNFSAATSSIATQTTLETRLEKRQRANLGPVGSRERLLVFIDDLNMPRKDEYGSQPPIELLKQWMDNKFWYDRKKQAKKNILGMQIMAAMGPPGGARSVISTRFQSRMHVINFTFPDWGTVEYIFKTMLSNHLSSFPKEIASMAESVTQGSCELFQLMADNFKPTPSKCHYVFNLRDIAKVTQGIMQISKSELETTNSMVGLWVHESMRIFHDRLNDDPDRKKFLQMLGQKLETKFDTNWETVFGDENVMPVFGRFLGDPDYGDVKGGDDDDDADQNIFSIQKYQNLTRDMKGLKDKLLERLEACNDDPTAAKPGNLVLFDQAIRHISRICRVIAQPRGCALLVGVGGSGRQSLSKLSSYVCEFKIFQIETTQRYRQQDFYEDLKSLYTMTGVQKKPTAFLFSDTQLIEESFLEDINNILNSGEVPGLFPPDELAPVLEDIRKDAEKEGRKTTQESLYSYFIERVRQNLHVLLCLSPVGAAFRNRCRMYPALINCCTINWFPPWPEEALTQVARQYMNDPVLSELKLDQKIIDVLPNVFCQLHTSAADLSTKMMNEMKRANYITPTKYLDLVQTYKKLIAEKTTDIGSLKQKLENGLGKLEATAKQVAALEVTLKEQGVIVDREKEKCDKLNVQIKKQEQEASAQKAKVQEESLKSKDDVDRCAKLEARATVELGKAMPALEAAQAALDKLDKKAITEVKSYPKPPPMVEKVMKGVMILLKKDTSWASCKKEMSAANFLEKLKSYDKDNISPKLLSKIKALRKDENFTPVFVGKISLAAGAMCDWVCAMDLYAEVFKKVKPLKEKLESAQEELKVKQAGLFKKQEELRIVEEKVAELQRNFQAAEKKKNDLLNKKQALELKKTRAMKLISGLSGEKVRWQSSIKEYSKDIIHLPGDCALAASFVIYAGPFDTVYRSHLTELWRKALSLMPENTYSEPKDSFICDFLSEPTTVRDWNIWGLPVDAFSTENGVIVKRTCRWPLMIDPQEQAKKWILNMEKKNKLAEIKVGQKNFMQPIETAISLGQPVLLKDIDESIPSSLDPLLRRTVDDKTHTISINDKDLTYSPTFMLYITTKLSNPHYLPETSIKSTLVNFMVKPEGLEEQLLGIVVNKEKPDLEEKNTQLVLDMAQNKKTLKELEDKILDLLKKADAATILDDEHLINTLDTSKVTSEKVKHQIKVAEETSKKINESRNEYRPAAIRSSVLYFVLNDLARIDPMYQFSLQWYNDLFKMSIDDSKQQKKKGKGRGKSKQSVSKRLRELNNYHTESVYKTVCQSLFERHKLLYSFQICTSILKEEGKIIPEEFTFFLRGGVVLDRKARGANPCNEWLSEEAWDNISELDKLNQVFAGFSSAFEQQSSEWQEWYQSDMKGGEPPEKLDLPGELLSQGSDYEKKFRKMMIVRCLRPDRVNYAVTNYVSSIMGEQYVQPPSFDLSETFNASKTFMPVIFVLSPGSDPTQMLNDLARERKIKLAQVALGQGQAPIAERLFTEGVRDGNWVLLANCHLSIRWLPVLENMVMALRERKDVHPGFRLWLSSDPTPKFPIALLQSSIKITTEPPRGLRSIMQRMYNFIPEDKFNKMDSKKPQSDALCNKPIAYKSLLFALTFFHAVLVERKKFLTLGWNIPYAFNDSDFLVCDNLLRYYLNEQDQMPLEALKYLIAQALYGGRVTDEIDRRLLGVYIEQYFTMSTISVKNFHLSQDRTHYRVPVPAKYDSYINYIKTLPPPGGDPPEAFGQHPNADITMQQEGAKLLLDTVMSLQPRSSGGEGSSSEDFVLNLAKQLEDRVPPLFNLEKVEKKFAHDQSPLKTVLLQEIERYNVILALVEKSLKDLQMGIKGLIVISADLEVVFDCLLQNKVPPSWKSGYYSLKPLASWMTDLIERIKQFAVWIAKGAPKVFWLSGFTFPNGFLTALLQTSARANGVPIDSLGWEFLVSKEEEKAIQVPAKDGAYIKGFFLEGAQWDLENWHLEEPMPMQLYAQMPIINFKPIDQKKVKEKGFYSCPCYRYPIRTGTRENPSYVLNVRLKLPPAAPGFLKGTSDFWIKRGTALLLSLAT